MYFFIRFWSCSDSVVHVFFFRFWSCADSVVHLFFRLDFGAVLTVWYMYFLNFILSKRHVYPSFHADTRTFIAELRRCQTLLLVWWRFQSQLVYEHSEVPYLQSSPKLYPLGMEANLFVLECESNVKVTVFIKKKFSRDYLISLHPLFTNTTRWYHVRRGRSLLILESVKGQGHCY